MKLRLLTRTSNWMVLWGWMDLAGVAVYLGARVLRGRIPLWDDVSAALTTSHIYGNSFPLIVSAIEAIVVISIIASGYLLIRRRDAGRYVAVAQFPFRVAFFMPSLFFFGYMKSGGQSAYPLLAVLLVSEMAKLWSIRPRATIA